MLNRFIAFILIGFYANNFFLTQASDQGLIGFQKSQKEYLDKIKSISKPYFFEIMGKSFVGLPDVFSPPVFADQGSIFETLPLKSVKSFLEIGSGTGYIAVIAALSGVSRVTALDINPNAVTNTRINVLLHHLEDRITVKESNVFSSLSEAEKFDLIYFDVPFNESDQKTLPLVDRTMYDPLSVALTAYLRDGKKHLTPQGSMIINRSEVLSDMKKFYGLAKEYGWEIEVLRGQAGPVKTTTFQLR